MNNKNLKSIFFIFLIIILSITNNVYAESNYLYDVLKNEAENGELAREYTGEHQDSMIEEPSKKIYHWYAEDNTQGTEIQNKNNVIFGNYCWQMIRTTDTGGVKMIYNGKAENGKCLSTRSNQFGYELQYKSPDSTSTYNPLYYYYPSYRYDSSTRKYTLYGEPISSDWSLENVNKLVGKYTCMDSYNATPCTDMRYIKREVFPGTAYYLVFKNTMPYSSFGKSSFNSVSSKKDFSLALSGYMTNYNYNGWYRDLVKKQTILMNMYYNAYYYSSTIQYDNNLKMYYMTNKNTISGSNLSSLVGKYLTNCNNCSSFSPVYYVEGTSGTYFYGLPMRNGETAATYNDYISVADNIIEKEDGTYELEAETTVAIPYLQWYDKYNQARGKYTCLSKETQCEKSYKIVSASLYDFAYIPIEENYLFASDYDYNEETNEYTLSGDTITSLDVFDNYSLLDTHHFSCLTTDNKCSELYVIHNYSSSKAVYYQPLKNGESLDERINKMFSSDQTNQENSNIKELIDYWYEQNIISKEKFLEDTIYCNDRSIIDLGGWDTNNGNVKHELKYKGSESTKDLSCSRIYDKFSIYNNLAHLSYPIGLLTRPEAELNGLSTLKTGNNYWLLTPNKYDYLNANTINYITSNGTINSELNYMSYIYVRPVISLKNNSSYTSGNGTYENPYVFEEVVKSNITVVNDQSLGSYSMNKMEEVEENSLVKLNVSPNTGYQVSNITVVENGTNNPVDYEIINDNYQFTMPPENTTITIEYEKVKNGISVEIVNETEDLEIEINDITQVQFEEEVSFKVKPIKGYKVNSISIVDSEENEIDYNTSDNINYTFIMPASNVKIIPRYVRVSNEVVIEDNSNTKQITIEVEDAKAVVYEDIVRFVVKPEEGYEVEDIVIKDAEGKKVDYKKTNKENEYEFTMPDTAVVITPKYRLIEMINENPKTGNIIMILISLLAIISTITILSKKTERVS